MFVKYHVRIWLEWRQNYYINRDIIHQKGTNKRSVPNFFDQVRRQVNKNIEVKNKPEEIEKSRYFHQGWAAASETTPSKL